MLLSIGYCEVVTESDDLVLEFRSARDVIKHIKDTGVGGSTNHAANLGTLLKTIPTHLTYRPVYIIAMKMK